jgi:hypothetical protein
MTKEVNHRLLAKSFSALTTSLGDVVLIDRRLREAAEACTTFKAMT